MSKYLIDGESVEWKEIIDRAKEYGYYEPSSIYFTSRAARVLREHGHRVEEEKVEITVAQRGT